MHEMKEEMGETGKSRVQPAFDGGDLVFADDDFRVGETCNVDAHLAKEVGREFVNGCGVNDELTVDTHEALGVELALGFFEGHRQLVGLALQGAEAHHPIADGEMAHVADGNNQIFVGTMRDEETLSVSDGLTLHGCQQLRNGIGGGQLIVDS